MIITRISRLFRADIHHLLDCIEEPEVLVKQAVREMEVEIERDLAESERAANLKKRLEQEREERAREIGELELKIKRAFEAGEEGLARTFVKRRLVSTNRAARILRDIMKLDESLSELEKKVAERKTKLEEIREKAKLFKEANRKSAVTTGVTESGEVGVSDEDVELAFVEARREFERVGAQ